MIKALAPKGQLIIIHAAGKDPANQIIKKIWPKENPFPSLKNEITKYLKSSLSSEELKRLKFLEKKIIRCKLRALPNEIQGGIATSVIFSAWNVATYVNQIDDYKVLDAEKSQKYQKIVSTVVNKNNGLYFNNEMFIISKT
jgi:hypothetical protein